MRKYFRNEWLNRMVSFVMIMLILFGLSLEYAQGQISGWSTPNNYSQQPDTPSWAPTILCDQYQNLHVFWEEKTEAIDGIPLSTLFYKTDLGGIWSQPLDLLITPRFEELYAAITPNDMVHLVWTNAVHELIYFRASLASANRIRRWAKPVILASEAYSSNVVVDDKGMLYIIYTTTNSEAVNHAIYYKSSADFGDTWSKENLIIEIDTPIPSTVNAQLAIDGRGMFHVVYTVRSFEYGKYSVLKYIRSIDAGVNWDSSLTFPQRTTFQGLALLAEYVFGDDEIHLTYDTPERLHQWSYDGGETWSQPIPIVNGVEVGAAFSGYNQLIKDGSGTLHVVFAQIGAVFHSTWNGVDWSVAELIDTPDFDPHGQTEAICQGNRLSVLYGGNEEKSEIWYSEKLLDLPSIPQSPIPIPLPTPTMVPTPLQNTNVDQKPIPTEITVVQPPREQKQSIQLPITLASVLVIILITATLVNKIIQRET